MAREILLMQDVNDLGQEGDIVSVAEGHARNYLIPRGLAAPVTAAARRRYEKLRVERETERASALKSAQEKAAALGAVSLTITAKTSDGEKLYGSVTTAEIADALKEQGQDVDRDSLTLDQPIKELGMFEVPVRVHPKVSVSVKVWVVEE